MVTVSLEHVVPVTDIQMIKLPSSNCAWESDETAERELSDLINEGKEHDISNPLSKNHRDTSIQ